MFVLLEENNGFNDVTQFEIHEEAIGKMPKMYQTNGEKRVRKSVELQIKKDIKTVSKNMKKTLKMTSGKGVEKCDGKRCPGETQADGNSGEEV